MQLCSRKRITNKYVLYVLYVIRSEKSVLNYLKFLDTDPSNLIISSFAHFEQPFSLKNSKTTYSAPFKTFLCTSNFKQI